MRTLGIIVSAGKGKRFGDSLPKQFHLINGIPVIARALFCFERSNLIDKICLVIDNKYMRYYEKKIKKYKLKKIFNIVHGGKERQDSVYNGLMSSGNNWDIVVVHDGVRPFVSEELLNSVVRAAEKFGAAIPGVKPYDTLKVKSKSGIVKETLKRDMICAVQTPQAFRYEILKKAHLQARQDKYTGTDDAELVERIGKKVKIVEGDYRNIKITTKYDLIIGSAIAESL
jgi:2-C-methyl-D-erythritol 4-phosphate cytidylyltransferase